MTNTISTLSNDEFTESLRRTASQAIVKVNVPPKSWTLSPYHLIMLTYEKEAFTLLVSYFSKQSLKNLTLS